MSCWNFIKDLWRELIGFPPITSFRGKDQDLKVAIDDLTKCVKHAFPNMTIYKNENEHICATDKNLHYANSYMMMHKTKISQKRDGGQYVEHVVWFEDNNV